MYVSLLAEVVGLIRSLDRDEISDRQFRSAALGAIAEKIPPGEHAWPALPPGSTPADAAKFIAAALTGDPAPASSLFSRLAGGVAITVKPVTTAHLRLSVTEAEDLDAKPREAAWEREGLLMCGELPVAHSRGFLIRRCVPEEEWERITVGGEPIGKVLGPAPFRLRRVRQKVFVSRTSSAAVDSSAALLIRVPDGDGERDLIAGTAHEHVTTRFCAHVAALAG